MSQFQGMWGVQFEARVLTKSSMMYGLKAARRSDGKIHQCMNCRCNRYSPCGCMKNKQSTRQPKGVTP